jgi:CSLREA domain-containing protein
LRVFFAAVLALLALAGPAGAATIRVTETADSTIGSNGLCSLREAIMSARQDASASCISGSGTDTIIVPAGYYRLRLAGDDDTGLTGDLDVGGTTTIVGGGRLSTMIDAGDLDRVFHVLPAGDLTLRSLMVTGGNTAFSGGGVLNEGTLALRDVLLSGNSAGAGGGIFISGGGVSIMDSAILRNVAGTGNGGGVGGGDVMIARSIVAGNRAGGPGGGIDAEDLTASQTAFSGNTASSEGGGLFISRSATLTDVTLRENVAGSFGGGLSLDFEALGLEMARVRVIGNRAATGGGIDVNGGSGNVTIADSVIADNFASGDGGGLNNETEGVIVSRSTFSGNLARDGDGLFDFGFDTTLANVTISGNGDGTGSGGGIWSCAVMSLINVTIAENRASDSVPATGGNVWTGAPGDCAQISAKNSLFARDLSGGNCAGGGSIQNLGGNIVFDDEAACGIPGEGAYAAQLGELQNNGGPTPTRAIVLPAGSAALNHAVDCLPTDQRGVPRPQGGGCDSGAYELARCLGGIVNRVGTPTADRMKGNSTAEVFLTLGGNDTVTPRGGNDRLCLGTGNDTAKIRGGGKDRAAGQAGRDRVQRDASDIVSGFESFF